MGTHASKLITEIALAIKNHLKVADCADLVRLHPSLNEMIGEAYKAFSGKSINFISK